MPLHVLHHPLHVDAARWVHRGSGRRRRQRARKRWPPPSRLAVRRPRRDRAVGRRRRGVRRVHGDRRGCRRPAHVRDGRRVERRPSRRSDLRPDPARGRRVALAARDLRRRHRGRDGARQGGRRRPGRARPRRQARSTRARGRRARPAGDQPGPGAARRGRRLFDGLGPEHIELELTRVVDAPSVTHLRYEVSRATPER